MSRPIIPVKAEAMPSLLSAYLAREIDMFDSHIIREFHQFALQAQDAFEKVTQTPAMADFYASCLQQTIAQLLATTCKTAGLRNAQRAVDGAITQHTDSV